MIIKTFTQAVKFLEKFIPPPSKKHPGELGLKRMQYLMDLLGNPQFAYPTIHVGGTSGKGSTATMIASILAAKYKVGLHTSPHLVKITERIKIYQPLNNFAEVGKNFSAHLPRSLHSSASGGLKVLKDVGVLEKLASPQNYSLPASPIDKTNDLSEREFVNLVNKIIPFIKKMEKSEFSKPSYFELISAIAFLYFYQQKVDIAVVEVGMGGRFDATNVIKPMVAVITNVGLDHTEVLGDTVEKIAQDKVRIIKPNMKVVSGARQSSVAQIIKLRCREKNAHLSLLNRDFRYKVKDISRFGSIFDYFGEKIYRNLKLSLLGEFQVENAALAVRTAELLYRHSGDPPAGGDSRIRFWTSQNDLEKSICQGLEYAFILGRLEIVSRKPLVILDGAHNPDKARALVSAIKKIFPEKRITAIVAIKDDKAARAILFEFLKICHKIIFTHFQILADVGVINSYNPEELLNIASKIDNRKQMIVIDNAKRAIDKAIKSVNASDLILVTGSLYLIGEARKRLASRELASS